MKYDTSIFKMLWGELIKAIISAIIRPLFPKLYQNWTHQDCKSSCGFKKSLSVTDQQSGQTICHSRNELMSHHCPELKKPKSIAVFGEPIFDELFLYFLILKADQMSWNVHLRASGKIFAPLAALCLSNDSLSSVLHLQIGWRSTVWGISLFSALYEFHWKIYSTLSARNMKLPCEAG